jgi:cellulose synthase/poly-beta-1,6-N-acetylglucosamine synthase-like glycosyltransferase
LIFSVKCFTISINKHCFGGKVLKKVLLAIPAFNEEKNIGLVLNDLLASDKEFDILVINDGSKTEPKA